jgi:tetrahydromethanopterin S-methyltransferase subunit D
MITFNREVIITTIVTFVLFFLEGLVHYNIGNPSDDFEFPKGMELVKMLTALLICSALSGYISEHLHRYFAK